MQKKKNVLGFVLQNWKFMTRVEHILKLRKAMKTTNTKTDLTQTL